MDLSTTPKEEIVDPAWLEEYNKQINALWSEVYTLVTRVYLLGKISRFPFEPLYAGSQVPFWTTIYFALFESAILAIWRIAVDTGGDFLTLRSLKNEIFKNIRSGGPHDDGDIKAALAKALKDSKFEEAVSDVEESVRDLRHTYIAHLRRERATGAELRTSDFLPVVRIEQITEVIKAKLNILAFYQRFPYLPIQYDPSVREADGLRQEPDIDILLTRLAEESKILHSPETSPLQWPHRKKRMSSEHLDQINYYREKLGLGRA